MNERNTRLINLIPSIFFALTVVCVFTSVAQLRLAIKYLLITVIIDSAVSLVLAIGPNNRFRPVHILNGLLLLLSSLAVIALFRDYGFTNNWF
jgi:hypothetical protein